MMAFASDLESQRISFLPMSRYREHALSLEGSSKAADAPPPSLVNGERTKVTDCRTRNSSPQYSIKVLRWRLD
jgi:hypothetical protein